MMRKITVTRRCGAVPEYHISTRLVGMDMDTFVMSPPWTAHAGRALASAETLEHGHRRHGDVAPQWVG